MQDAQLAWQKRLRGVDIYAELEKMLGSEARFRGLQEPVLQAIIKHQSPIVAVIGTGARKTLLFQLLAKSMSSRTMVVISLLVSLQDHIVERCQQAGISCVKWDPCQCYSPSQIVIITLELVVSKTFRTFWTNYKDCIYQSSLCLISIIYYQTAQLSSGPRCSNQASQWKGGCRQFI